MEKTFYAQGMTEEQFFATINQWFAANRHIKIRNLYTAESTRGGFLVNKSTLSNITLIYDVDESINALHGIAYHERFSLIKISAQTMRDEWQKVNPHLQVVTYSYIHNARGQAGTLMFNGFGANNRNQLWIIYKVRENSASAPASQGAAPKFCSACGKPLQPGAKFCAHCGNKIG